MKNVIDNKTKNVAIIGAGIAGLSIAVLLSRQGYTVDIFEKLEDARLSTANNFLGRSINFTISARGIQTLKLLGIFEEVKQLCVPLYGRHIHRDFSTQIQRYSIEETQVLYSITRMDLTKTLLKLTEKENIKIKFNYNFQSISQDRGKVQILSNKDLQSEKDFNFVIGADGTFSTIRRFIQSVQPSTFIQEYSEFFYKELRIPPSTNSTLEFNAIHIWPVKEGILVAIPNFDMSFTLNMILNSKNFSNFENLDNDKKIKTFFKNFAPDLSEFLPVFIPQILNKKQSPIIINKLEPWYYTNKLVLIGDACHSVAPFLGQGMNAALEDSVILSQLIQNHPKHLEEAFRNFQQIRKKDTDALTQLSNTHLLNLKNSSKLNTAKIELDFLMNKVFGSKWIPFYSLISFTLTPYLTVLQRIKKRKYIEFWFIPLFYLFLVIRNNIDKILKNIKYQSNFCSKAEKSL